MPKKTHTKILSILIIGDSLTDRGKMNVRKLLGVLPMKYLSGLAGVSPDGRFTNGYNWADIISYALIDDFKINVINSWGEKSFNIAHSDKLKEGHWHNGTVQEAAWTQSQLKKKTRYYKKSYTDDDYYAVKAKHSQFAKLFHHDKSPASANAEIADAILHDDKKVTKFLNTYVSLDNNEEVHYKNNKFARSIAEGGATASNFFLRWSWSPKHFFSRLVLKNLKSFRKMIFKSDEKEQNAFEKNQDTLVLEWTGANDIATVNPRPTPKMARRAVQARIENVRKMLKKGYKHFVLFNIPDLSLTPRYQVKQRKHINYAYLTSKVFNDTLQAEVEKLKRDFPEAMFDVFDVNALFQDMYKHPEKFGFDKDKLTTPFLEVKEHPVDESGQSPAKGYVFWDDVHSTADAQAQKALALIEFLSKIYDIQPELISKIPFPQGFAPPMKLDPIALKKQAFKADFVKAYTEKLDEDYYRISSLFGFWRKSKVPYLAEASLDDIVNFGITHKKSRTYHVMKEAHWVGANGEIDTELQTVLSTNRH